MSQDSSFLHHTIVVIPALNEADAIGRTVAYWQRRQARLVRVVDNGSADSTAEFARSAGADVVPEPSQGYGAAAWRGTQGIPDGVDWVLFSAADGSDRLTVIELADWQHHVDNGCDLLIGDRFSALHSRRQLKFLQTIGNRLSCALILWGWGRRFNDMGSLRLVRRGALERMNLRDRKFGWNAEMQVRAVERGLCVTELPVIFHPRSAGKSKISGNFLGSLKAGIGILWTLAKLWREKIASRKIDDGRATTGQAPHDPSAIRNRPCAIATKTLETRS